MFASLERIKSDLSFKSLKNAIIISYEINKYYEISEKDGAFLFTRYTL